MFIPRYWVVVRLDLGIRTGFSLTDGIRIVDDPADETVQHQPPGGGVDEGDI